MIDRNLKSVEYTDQLSTIKVPTLLIVGDHDESDQSNISKMHEDFRVKSDPAEIRPHDFRRPTGDESR